MTQVETKFPWPIAVMSFQRPYLLRPVLESLKAQTRAFDESNVYLFQDGFIDSFDGDILGKEETNRECVDIFREIFPKGQVHDSQNNLGVALNFERAEGLFFKDMGVDAALFLEDDLVLSLHYLTAMTALLDFALTTPLVAYVAAYGEHRETLEAQFAQRGRIVPMKHKWGFGLTRRQWERQQPIVEDYLKIVRRRPYMKRDHAEIRAYFQKIGYASPGTSQDAMKDVASAVLGTVKIMTFACFGKYVGRVGVHQSERDYVKQGYDDTQLFPDPVETFDFPDEARLQALADVHRAAHAPSPPAAVPLAGTPPKLFLPKDIIGAAYRALLNREPDPNGLAAYEQTFVSRAPDEAVFRMLRSMLASEEFANKWRPPTKPAASE